jgi:hypothetical protein
MACTINNSKIFHKGGRVVVKPILVNARRAPRFLPPTSRLDRPSVSQSTRDLNARTKRSTAEVQVPISYSLPRSSSVVVALQGVATTYHDALKVPQSIMLFVSPPCPSALPVGVD